MGRRNTKGALPERKRFEYLCSQCSCICGFPLHSGRVGVAAGFSKWACVLRNGMRPDRRRVRRTASAVVVYCGAPQPVLIISRVRPSKYRACLICRVPSVCSGEELNPFQSKYTNTNNPNFVCLVGHARIVQPPRDVAVLDGEDALFFCVVEGNPEPTVSFLLDGQPGRLSAETGKVLPIPGSGGGSLLRLFKVSAKQSGIKVECLASNHVGNDRASANLKVYKYTDGKLITN